MRRPCYACCTLFALLLAVACNDSTSAHPCSAAAVGPLTIGAGTTPSISWAASCPAEFLAVIDPASGLPLWQLRANTRKILKPVTYGLVPAGVTEEHNAEILQVGISYDVLVSIVTGSDTLSTLGTFTP